MEPASPPVRTSRVDVRVSVHYRADNLGFPTALALARGYLIITNPYAEPHIHVIDPQTKSLVASFGRSGAGPGEYRSPLFVSAATDTDLVWIGDPNLGRITELSLDSVLSGGRPFRRAIPLQTRFREVIPLKRGFLVHDWLGGSKFLLVDRDGRVLARVGPSPPVTRDVPASVASIAYADLIAHHPTRDLMAAAGIRTGSLVFYDLQGNIVDSARTPFQFTPSFRVGRQSGMPSMVPERSAPYGYVGIGTTEEYLVLVFSGRTLRDYGPEAAAGQELHVFSWQGNLLFTYLLDTAVRFIVIDERAGVLYGSKWEDDPAVVSVKLPFLAQ